MTRQRIHVLATCLLVTFGTSRQLVGQTLPLMRTTASQPEYTGECDPAARQCAALYLDGAFRTADKNESAAATGSIGVNLERGRWQLVTQVDLVAATDTIRQSPGQSLLVPGSGGFRNGLLEGRARIWKPRVLARAYYSLSSYTWELPTSVSESAHPIEMSILGPGTGLV